MSLKSHIPTNRNLRPIQYTFITCFLTMLVVSSAWARPALVTVEKVQRDTSVILKLEEQFIVDDSQVPCEMIVEVLGENRPLAEGDTIDIVLNINSFESHLRPFGCADPCLMT